LRTNQACTVTSLLTLLGRKIALPAGSIADAGASQVGRIHGKRQAYSKNAIHRLVAVFAAIAALVLFAGSAGAQSGSGTVTIHSRLCPAGQPTTDTFTDCHGHLPTIATSYSLDGGAAQTVGGDGNTSFTGLPSGSVSIAQVDGVPLDFARLRAFCSDQTAGTTAVEETVDVNTFSVDAVDGHEIICDVYTIPEDASGNTPTPTTAPAAPTATATSTSGGTTSLPNTGSGPTSGRGNELLLIALMAVVFAAFGFGITRARPNGNH
jgi:hypothetical protein